MATAQHGPSGQRVLIVDEDPLLADNLAEIVTLAGGEAFTSQRADDALIDVGCSSVDVIVTDSRVRGMYGAGLLSKLRLQGSGAAFVLITTRSEDDVFSPSRDQVPRGPIDMQRLLSVLLQAIHDRNPRPRR
jgi:DNA-binding NtrC family response regulator